jgi:hypothetical protein
VFFCVLFKVFVWPCFVFLSYVAFVWPCFLYVWSYVLKLIAWNINIWRTITCAQVITLVSMSTPHLTETARVVGKDGYTSAPCSNCSFESVGRGFGSQFDTVVFESEGSGRFLQKWLTLCEPCSGNMRRGTVVRIGETGMLWKHSYATRENTTSQ